LNKIAAWLVDRYANPARQKGLLAVSGHEHLPDLSGGKLGCGHWGCVYRTPTAGEVMKATLDRSEGLFVAAAIDIGVFPPGIVRYRLLVSDPVSEPEQFDGLEGADVSMLYLLWREEASFGHETDEAREALEDQLAAAMTTALGLASDLEEAERVGVSAEVGPRVEGLRLGDDGKVVGNAYADTAARSYWKHVRMMKRRPPSKLAAPIWEAMRFYLGRGLVLADLHEDNLGAVTRDGRTLYVVVDPGTSGQLPWSPLSGGT